MDLNDTPDEFQFLDYGGLEEQERAKIQSFLCSPDSCVQLPYPKQPQCYGYGEQPQNYTININNVGTIQNIRYEPNVKANEARSVPHTAYQQGYYQMPPVYAAYPGQGEPYPQLLNNIYPEKPSQGPYINAVYPPFAPNAVNLPSSHAPAPPNNVNYNTAFPTKMEFPQTLPKEKIPESGVIHDAAQKLNDVKLLHKPAMPTLSEKTPENHTPVIQALPNSNLSITTEVNNKPAATNQQSENSTKLINGVDSTPTRKSWASLFNKSESGPQNSTPSKVITNGCSKPAAALPPFDDNDDVDVSEEFLAMKKTLKAKYDDPSFYRMGEFLSSHVVDNRIISLQPRGLINRSNYCYINSILQAMLACPPVYNLLSGLANEVPNEKEQLPIISGMSRLVKEFHHLPEDLRVGRRMDKNQKKDHSISINCDNPFEPAWIYKMLSGMRSDSFVIEGRQEDAEEFLGFLLNGLNDEMLDLIKLVSVSMQKRVNNEASSDQFQGDKEWQVMGPKNKGSVTRRTEFGRTPISDVFGGLLRSRVHRTGDQSTDNIQPFFTLQLNIEKVASVNEALEALVSKNQLEGVTSSKTNEEVEAWQQVTIEELPVVLVLHLKCFDFKLDGCAKIIKALKFPIDLKIDNKLLSSKSSSSMKEKQYKLFAVVYHDGPKATKGHYITDAYHVGYKSWLRYDDASVKAVQEDLVLKPTGTRVPYLLFYRRSDSIKSK